MARNLAEDRIRLIHAVFEEKQHRRDAFTRVPPVLFFWALGRGDGHERGRAKRLDQFPSDAREAEVVTQSHSCAAHRRKPSNMPRSKHVGLATAPNHARALCSSPATARVTALAIRYVLHGLRRWRARPGV
jgi:hypothetical protein